MERLEYAGVEGLRVGRFSSQINTTCIVYRVGQLVIDTGPPNQWPQVRRFLEERRVQQVVVTHHHEDHSGNLAAVAASGNVQALAPRGSEDLLARGFPLQAYRRVAWGRPGRFRPEALPDVLVADEETTLHSLATPGHSPDMTCLLERERGWLFSGDVYVAARARYLRADEDVGDQILSLRLLLQQEFATLFCAHRGPIADGPAALGRKLQFLEELCGRVAGLREAGRSERAIARAALGREGWMTWLTAFHFSKRHLVRSCLSAVDRGIVP